MRGSGQRAERHWLGIYNLTRQGMSAKELKETLEWRKSKNDDLSPGDMDEPFNKTRKDVKQKLIIDAEKEAVEEQRTVMSTVFALRLPRHTIT